MNTNAPAALRIDDLLSLEEYAAKREALRKEVVACKRLRRLHLGQHLTLLFENRTTIFYQVMEMLRIEKTTDDAGRQEELAAYNPLVPDGDNFKATLLIEYEDETQRQRELRRLHGIEHRMWCRIGDDAVFHAVADEDMARSDEEKTSAVHFLRYPLPAAGSAALAGGAALTFGCDHPDSCQDSGPLPAPLRESLLADLAH